MNTADGVTAGGELDKAAQKLHEGEPVLRELLPLCRFGSGREGVVWPGPAAFAHGPL